MSVRETSIEVYRRIESEGLLSKKRMEVYDCVFNHGPITSAEAAQIINQKNGRNSSVPQQIRARFTELREMGVIQEMNTRKCRVTGNTVILWDVTNNLPISPDKISKKERKDAAMSLLIKIAKTPGLPEQVIEELRELYRKVDVI